MRLIAANLSVVILAACRRVTSRRFSLGPPGRLFGQNVSTVPDRPVRSGGASPPPALFGVCEWGLNPLRSLIAGSAKNPFKGGRRSPHSRGVVHLLKSPPGAGFQRPAFNLKRKGSPMSKLPKSKPKFGRAVARNASANRAARFDWLHSAGSAAGGAAPAPASRPRASKSPRGGSSKKG